VSNGYAVGIYHFNSFGTILILLQGINCVISDKKLKNSLAFHNLEELHSRWEESSNLNILILNI